MISASVPGHTVRRSRLSEAQSKATKARANARPSRAGAAASHRAIDYGAATEEREAERREREAERIRRKQERRLDELEKGQASNAGWSEKTAAHILPASTSAAAIAGLLAGRQADETEAFDDLPSPLQGQAGGNAASSTTMSKKKQSAELRRLLSHRRGLRPLLEDASLSATFKNAPINFLTALQASSSPYPAHRATAPLCSICGYWGDVACMRCGERVCSLPCSTTHDETRCERPL